MNPSYSQRFNYWAVCCSSIKPPAFGWDVTAIPIFLCCCS